MKKLNLKTFFYLPFLFSFTFLWHISIFKNASINFLDILLIIAIITSICLLIIKKWTDDSWNYWTKKHLLIFIFLILFTLSSIIAWIVNLSAFNWTNSSGLIKSFIILPIIFSLFTSFFISKSYIKPFNLWKSFFISTGIVSILGIVAIITNNLTFDKRLSLFYDSPNHLAMMLSPAIIIGLWMLFYKKSLNKKFLSKKESFCLIILILIFLIINLFFTKSLGAIIATLISIIFLYLLRRKSFILTKASKFFILLLIFTSTIIALNTSYLTNKLDYIPALQPSSFDSRVTIYQSSEKIAKNNFPWGIGPGNFQFFYLNNQKYFAPYPQWAVPHAHNNTLHIYLEFGIIAFLSFFILIIIKLFSNKQQKKPEVILALAILIYFLVHGIFDTTIWHNDTTLLFWFTLLLL
jgi:O-antigen ligase